MLNVQFFSRVWLDVGPLMLSHARSPNFWTVWPIFKIRNAMESLWSAESIGGPQILVKWVVFKWNGTNRHHFSEVPVTVRQDLGQISMIDSGFTTGVQYFNEKNGPKVGILTIFTTFWIILLSLNLAGPGKMSIMIKILLDPWPMRYFGWFGLLFGKF